jgi:DNA polymerase-3 subunit gamma/tau
VSITAQPVRRPEAAVGVAEALDTPGIEPEGREDGPLKPINQALLLKVWEDYALARKREGRNSLHATLVAREPEVIGDRLLRFTIVNDVQEKYMREEKPTLLGHLRRALDLGGLDLQVEKAVVTDLRPRYTTRDRFNILVEKNPALRKLADELDLDLG